MNPWKQRTGAITMFAVFSDFRRFYELSGTSGQSA